VAWTHDGKLLLSAAGGGLSLLNLQSGSTTPLASQVPNTNFARSCGDGRMVFAGRNSLGTGLGIFLANADGTNAKEISNSRFATFPACTPDGKTVLYLAEDNFLRKVSTDGGAPQKASDYPVFSGISGSPDGKFAAFVSHQAVNDPREKLALLPLDSSQPTRFLDFERPRKEWYFSYSISSIAFSPDGKGIIYHIRNGDTDNLWQQNLDGSPGKQLTDFKSEFIRDFDYSFDGKQLAIIRGHREADVVLLRDTEK
jgi:Tol biopolymer transport system component